MAKDSVVGRAKGLFSEPLTPGVILTDAQIRHLVDAGSLIDLATFDEKGLDAVSYDVRIGKKAIMGGKGTEIDLTKDSLEISPGGYAAVISAECVAIPDDIVARINTKRSFSYEGIALLTGTQIDPGYKGHLLFGFYNASSRRVVLRRGRAICSLVFEALATAVSRPKAPDPNLLDGDFPERFINDMANMEVLSWQQLSENVKQIDRIATDLLQLKAKYDNVIKPIQDLTTNVDRVSQDVQKLSGTIGQMGGQLQEVEELTARNAQQVNETNTSVKMLIEHVRQVKLDGEKLAKSDEKHDEHITELRGRFQTFSVLVYVFWGLVTLVLGGLLTKYVLPKIFGP
jgi:dCTP deaminase